MCFVVQNYLGKGATAYPRCIPQAVALSWDRPHARASRTYRRSITRGRLRSPCTHRSKAFHGLRKPDQPCADWIPPSYRRWITLGGLSLPPNPARQTWRIPSPPTPNHVQPTARLTRATPWRPCHGDDFIETNRGGLERERRQSMLYPNHDGNYSDQRFSSYYA